MGNLRGSRNATEVTLGRVFLLILALATVLRLYGLGAKQLWVDEIIQAQCTNPAASVGSVLEGVREEIAAAPLDFLVQHLIAGLFGTSEFVLRLHSALFGVLTVWLVYRLADSLFGTQVAQVSALIFAVFPLHLQYAQEGRPYALLCLMTIALWLALTRLLLRRNMPSLMIYTGLLILAWYAHYFTIWTVISQSIFLLLPGNTGDITGVLARQKINGHLQPRIAAAVVVSLACFAPWVAWTMDRTHSHSSEHFSGTLFVHILKDWSGAGYPLSLTLLFLAMLGGLRLLRLRERPALHMLVCWAAAPVPLIFIALWARGYFFAIRQFLFITPPLMILAAHGILKLGDATARKGRRWRHMAPVLATVPVLIMSLAAFIRHLPDQREDLRGVGRFLQVHVSGKDAVYAPRMVPILAYYFPDIAKHALAALPDGAPSSPSGGRLFIVDTKYMTAGDRALAESLLLRYRGTVTLFRDVRSVMIPAAATEQKQ